ncbi:MAG: nucleotidyltransferase family protein [Bacteroidales bacterium]|nr:nucleotidyltransferase family protein [Bacteroidales bacterium]
MEGFVLAAGLGTRLRPLTDDRPKALVEVGGQPLLALVLERLVEAGVRHVVVNVHHFADQVEACLRSREWGCRVDISDERALLLDTGGALKHAASLFSGSEPVLVHNVDVLSTIDLREVVRCHLTAGNMATLCCSDRPTQRKLLFDSDGRLLGREGSVSAAGRPLAFSGISVVSPELFPLLPEADHPYPVIDQYIRLSPRHAVRCHVHPAGQWLDVGRPETLQKAQLWYPSSSK